jgi:hypothetical protein
MRDRTSRQLTCLVVFFWSAFAVGLVRAEPTLTPIDANRHVQCLSDAISNGEEDGGSGDESSMAFGPFNYDLSAPASVGSASSLGASAQSSQIDAMGFHATATLAVAADISDLDDFASANALNEFRVYFTMDGTSIEVPYSFTGWFAASDLVSGVLSLGDAGTGMVLHSFSAPAESVGFDFSGLLVPGKTYTLYAHLEALAGADPLGEWSQSGSGGFGFDFELPTDVAAPSGESGIATRLQVWPNPFGARSRITLEGPPYDGRLLILDVRGRLVREFRIESQQRVLSWNGHDQRGERLPAGIYFLRLAGAGNEATRKVTLLK